MVLLHKPVKISGRHKLLSLIDNVPSNLLLSKLNLHSCALRRKFQVITFSKATSITKMLKPKSPLCMFNIIPRGFCCSFLWLSLGLLAPHRATKMSSMKPSLAP